MSPNIADATSSTNPQFYALYSPEEELRFSAQRDAEGRHPIPWRSSGTYILSDLANSERIFGEHHMNVGLIQSWCYVDRHAGVDIGPHGALEQVLRVGGAGVRSFYEGLAIDRLRGDRPLVRCSCPECSLAIAKAVEVGEVRPPPSWQSEWLGERH